MEAKTEHGLRFGLIGCGDIGRVRAQALLRARPHRLVAVSDLDGRRASEIAAAHEASLDRDWQTLLQRDEVDAVIISTPPDRHAAMAIAALEAGKHVLCEKPLARTPAECEDILGAAERTGRHVATGFNYRFYPSVRMARRLLDQGAIGKLSHIHAYGGYSANSHAQAWVHDAGTVGGGALFDIGIHLIDLTRWFLGGVEEAHAERTNAVWGFPNCEDNGFLLMRGPEGRIATLHASWTEWGRYRFLLELVGDRGSLRVWCFPMRVELLASRQTGGKVKRKRWTFPFTMAGEHLRSYRWIVARSFVDEYHAFAAAIEGRPSAIATGRDGAAAIELAATGRTNTEPRVNALDRSA